MDFVFVNDCHNFITSVTDTFTEKPHYRPCKYAWYKCSLLSSVLLEVPACIQLGHCYDAYHELEFSFNTWLDPSPQTKIYFHD